MRPIQGPHRAARSARYGCIPGKRLGVRHVMSAQLRAAFGGLRCIMCFAEGFAVEYWKPVYVVHSK
jgi:hypothetical protein